MLPNVAVPVLIGCGIPIHINRQRIPTILIELVIAVQLTRRNRAFDVVLTKHSMTELLERAIEQLRSFEFSNADNLRDNPLSS